MVRGGGRDFVVVLPLADGTARAVVVGCVGGVGLMVALADEDRIGGTCLHRGCIPTKALLESAGFVEHVRHAKDYGLVLGADGTERGIDYVQMAARKDQVVKRMWTGLKTLIDKNKVTWIAGRGRLEGPTKIRVAQSGDDGRPGKGGDRVLQATDVILATGSRVKSLPGL